VTKLHHRFSTREEKQGKVTIPTLEAMYVFALWINIFNSPKRLFEYAAPVRTIAKWFGSTAARAIFKQSSLP
jgi:hypothetical protein